MNSNMRERHGHRFLRIQSAQGKETKPKATVIPRGVAGLRCGKKVHRPRPDSTLVPSDPR